MASAISMPSLPTWKPHFPRPACVPTWKGFSLPRNSRAGSPEAIMNTLAAPSPSASSLVQNEPIKPPLWLLAELTYRCPLHCVFCYNPLDFARDESEISTDHWLRVLREARE